MRRRRRRRRRRSFLKNLKRIPRNQPQKET